MPGTASETSGNSLLKTRPKLVSLTNPDASAIASPSAISPADGSPLLSGWSGLLDGRGPWNGLPHLMRAVQPLC